MNNLIGSSPRHPGLWQDETKLSKGVSRMPSHTQGVQELQTLTPELARLSQQGQWIVLISPPNIGYKQMLAQAGVRMDRILLVHAKDEIETLWAMEKALTSGTSSAVICWAPMLDSRDNRRLELVAKSATALGVVIESGSDHIAAQLPSVADVHVNQGSLFSAFH
ncbi:cell division inhibitor SulA [Shewanella waksmanii]|uniref:cell division inhibitor SulA n=1 Tax=Shewanella waksmanii TaxID=213783 RepID=UPI00048F4B11|nr:SulA-like leucine-rich domain-containing protein [Shewanella waksmanii]